MGWTIESNTEGYIPSIDENGLATFPTNDKGNDIICTIKYTDENGCTSNEAKCTVKAGSAPCKDEWSLTWTGGIFPLLQDYTGTGGTPIIMTVKHNGSGVDGLTANDFVLNIGPNGQYNELFTGLIVFQGGANAPYGIRINKAAASITCPYVDDELTCTIAPTACTEATLEFIIKIQQDE